MFKVVKRRVFMDEYLYSSCIVNGPHKLFYKIGETTVPELGYIMVFDNIWTTASWANDNIENWTILEGDGETIKAHRISDFPNNYLAIRQFWGMLECMDIEEVSNRAHTMSPPNNTVFVPSFTPTRIVAHNYNQEIIHEQ